MAQTPNSVCLRMCLCACEQFMFNPKGIESEALFLSKLSFILILIFSRVFPAERIKAIPFCGRLSLCSLWWKRRMYCSRSHAYKRVELSTLPWDAVSSRVNGKTLMSVRGSRAIIY